FYSPFAWFQSFQAHPPWTLPPALRLSLTRGYGRPRLSLSYLVGRLVHPELLFSDHREQGTTALHCRSFGIPSAPNGQSPVQFTPYCHRDLVASFLAEAADNLNPARLLLSSHGVAVASASLRAR